MPGHITLIIRFAFSYDRRNQCNAMPPIFLVSRYCYEQTCGTAPRMGDQSVACTYTGQYKINRSHMHVPRMEFKSTIPVVVQWKAIQGCARQVESFDSDNQLRKLRDFSQYHQAAWCLFSLLNQGRLFFLRSISAWS
jgi:hypothetical protein